MAHFISSYRRGPSNFEVIEVLDGGYRTRTRGVYATLDEARGCVVFDALSEYEIWQGDHIVEEREGVRGLRRFIDAPQAQRCTATIVLKDKTEAQCGRYATTRTLCTQHAKLQKEG